MLHGEYVDLWLASIFLKRIGFHTIMTKGVTMLSRKRTFWLAVFLCIFLFSGSAYALKFEGDAWLAQHYSLGKKTGEYSLVFDNSVNNVK